MSEFGDILKRLREQRGLTQIDIAQMIGSSKQVISRYEHGVNDPPISTAAKIAKALNVSIAVLAGEDPDLERVITDSDTVHFSKAAKTIAIKFDKLSAVQQKAITTMIDSYSV